MTPLQPTTPASVCRRPAAADGGGDDGSIRRTERRRTAAPLLRFPFDPHALQPVSGGDPRPAAVRVRADAADRRRQPLRRAGRGRHRRRAEDRRRSALRRSTPSPGSVEFGISVADDWHGQGAGSALLSNLECRAAALGADRIFGDALGTNQDMLGLARKRGYRFSHPPGDWTLKRFTKDIRIAQDIPCVQSSRALPALAAAG